MTTIRILLVAMGFLLAAVLAMPTPAAAHPMPYTGVVLDVRQGTVGVELQLPVNDLALASAIDLRTATSVTLGQRAFDLGNYLRRHLRLTTPDGRAWTVAIGHMSVSDTERGDAGPYREVVAHAVVTPPPGADMRRFAFAYDAIVHGIATHEIVVSVRQDWAAGRVDIDAAAQPIGVIRTDTLTMAVPTFSVDLSAPSHWRGFVAMVGLGAHHILAGPDHLLFLLAMLLSAPLAAQGGRWRGYAGLRRTVKRIAAITVAFTLGHSVALAITALSRVEFSQRPVEVLIAASILISAAHAVRPLFPGREAVVAGGFGLVHGMAFSFTLAAMDLSSGELAVSLLGFNLGIEAIQLLLVLVALPPLVLLATTRFQPLARLTGAAFAIISSTGWLVERIGLPNPLSRMADQLGAISPGLATGLVVVSAVAALMVFARHRAASGGGRVADTLPQPGVRSVSVVTGMPGHADLERH